MKNTCNIKKYDVYFRLFLSFILLIIAVFMQYYSLMIFSTILAYTALKKHCWIYSFFKINEKYSAENYYMAHLPKYNPSAVFMFDRDGEIKFENKNAIDNFSHIKNFKDFNFMDLSEIIQTELNDIFYYDYKEFSYQFDVVGVKDIKSVLVYATDITEIMDLNEEIEKTQKEIIYTMGEIGETRSRETGNHVKRVAEYSELLALLYGLNKQEASKLKMASPMHDIGKVGIPDAILNKPGRHTVDEFKVMQTHSILGYEMLKGSDRPIIKAAAIVALEHHEKYDGSGYPNGTAGEDIHIYGRITAIADVFDALGSKRVYKEAWDLNRILDLFKEEKGKQFDPKLVDLFLDNLDKFLSIKDRYKDI
ncbi:MAG TPA: HD domain-containing protein [Arcobacter sp.]|nr:HD domain-containing protein [Arcobacter sp.]